MFKRISNVVGSVLAVWLMASPALAQFRIDVSGVGADQYPISVAGFKTDNRLPVEIANVIRNDLTRSGSFKLTEAPNTLTENETPNYVELKAKGADAVVGGSISKLADGRYDVRYRLTDVAKQSEIVAESVIASEGDLRFAAHRIADSIYRKLTGERGIFATRIAFVSKQGSRFRLNIADWDGENIQVALTSPEPIISPAWSPDGGRIAYVSFESRKPTIYVHSLGTGQRTVAANFKGSNSAPAWSPDGQTLAVTLTRDGGSQLYLVPAAGGEARRISMSQGIDTEPNFSPDGRTIYFTSDRGGSPQIYRLNVGTGESSRLSFNGNYNVSPRISPDGAKLSYLARRNGKYIVVLRDLNSNGETILSENGTEESPSFAPNGKWVLYATNVAGRDYLISASTDGRVKQRLSAGPVDIREPTWGPFPR
jgi:TolB protein